MTARDIFASLSPEQAEEVFGWLHTHNRATYRACMSMLATRRKLRPVFVERKPLSERHAWLKDAFSRINNNDIATEILQSWLLEAHGKMVCDFLDVLGVPHDGKGLVESFPPEPPASEIARAIEAIYENHTQTAVLTYLNLLIGMKIANWPELEKAVHYDPRLCLKTPQNL